MARFILFDEGGAGDRYTLIDTKQNPSGWVDFIGFNAEPYHPQGIGQHGSFSPSDWRSFEGDLSHLGKPIEIEDLPESAQRFARSFIAECEAGDPS